MRDDVTGEAAATFASFSRFALTLNTQKAIKHVYLYFFKTITRKYNNLKHPEIKIQHIIIFLMFSHSVILLFLETLLLSHYSEAISHYFEQ